jgi:hypothetical protein
MIIYLQSILSGGEMPILTKSAVVKNVPAPFTLNKSLLAALPLVSNDPYFSVQLNWSKIVLVYKSSIGEQESTVIFEASQTVPSGDFFISSKARDFFNVERIDIYDFDNDRISIPRSALNVADFDIDMSVVLAFFSQPLGVDTYTVSANSVVKSSGADAYNSSIISTASISSDGYVQFTNASRTGIERLLVGIGKNPRTGSYVDIEYCFNNGDAGYGIYESGTLSYVSPVIPTAGDVLKITRVSNVVKYYINGNLAYTSTFPSSGSYYIEASLYDIGSAITNCSVVDS